MIIDNYVIIGWVVASSDSGQLFLTKVEVKDGVVLVKHSTQQKNSVVSWLYIVIGKVHYCDWRDISLVSTDFW